MCSRYWLTQTHILWIVRCMFNPRLLLFVSSDVIATLIIRLFSMLRQLGVCVTVLSLCLVLGLLPFHLSCQLLLILLNILLPRFPISLHLLHFLSFKCCPLFFCSGFCSSLLSLGTCREFIPNVICLLDEGFIMSISVFIVQIREYQFIPIRRTSLYSVATHLPVFELESLCKPLLHQAFAGLWLDFVLLTSKYSLGHLLLLHPYKLLPPFLIDVEKLESVSKYLLLDLVVQRWIGSEWGRLVDFDQPGLEIAINHDIEAKNLIAHWIIVIVRLARPVDVRHVGLTNY